MCRPCCSPFSNFISTYRIHPNSVQGKQAALIATTAVDKESSYRNVRDVGMDISPKANDSAGSYSMSNTKPYTLKAAKQDRSHSSPPVYSRQRKPYTPQEGPEAQVTNTSHPPPSPHPLHVNQDSTVRQGTMEMGSRTS